MRGQLLNPTAVKKTGDARLGSPYNTPKGGKGMPLQSPLVGDAMQLQALDLQPGITPVDEDTRREFLKFKAQQEKERKAA